MARTKSTETQLAMTPLKFAIDPNMKIATPIKGEPPVGVQRGRKLHPVISKLYNQLYDRRDVWFHVNIQFTNKKQMESFKMSLYNRARKDDEYISSCSVFNDDLKVYELWVKMN